MKIGEFKFKRKYSAGRVIVDIFSLAFLALIIANTVIFANNVAYTNNYLNRTDIEVELVSWYPALIWVVLAGVISVLSIIFTYMHKKLPKKYVIDETNVRAYCDIVDTAISCIRLVLLFAIFDLSGIHQTKIAYGQASWFSVQLLCDVFFILVLWRFSVHRLRGISIKPDEEKREITED